MINVNNPVLVAQDNGYGLTHFVHEASIVAKGQGGVDYDWSVKERCGAKANPNVAMAAYGEVTAQYSQSCTISVISADGGYTKTINITCELSLSLGSDNQEQGCATVLWIRITAEGVITW